MTRRQHPSIGEKVQLTHKLFLLANARNTLDQELLHFTKKAYEEVQCFLNSSFPSCVFSDLVTGLDKKCQTVDKLSALLKDLTVQPQLCDKNGLRTNQVKPLKEKLVSQTDVLKFGPMLQNLLMASSIAKAVQVLGPMLPLKQFKHFLLPQPTAVQQGDTICKALSSYKSAADPEILCFDFKKEEKKHAAVFEVKPSTEAVILPPEMSVERPPLLLPPIPAILPEISNPTPMKLTTLMSWGCEDDVQVQHQKQTSSQLLRFLRVKAKNAGAPEVTIMEWRKSSPQSVSPTIKTQSYQFSQAMADDVINAMAPKTLHTEIENHAPVFRVKRVESSGSLTYTCVIATKTELWDIGDIFISMAQGDSEEKPFENEDCTDVTARVENPFVNMELKTQTQQSTQPDLEKNSTRGKTQSNISTTISEFQVRKFEETEVVVSHIVSPWNFYIQHIDANLKMQALITDSWKASHSYAEQNCIPDIGTHVIGWFPKQEQWCRAQVTKICGVSRDSNAADGAEIETSIKVEVKRLDYGDTACLSLSKIKEMTLEMTALPLQAAQVSLANVSPVNGSDWSKEAVDWFHAIVHNRTLYARLYPQGLIVTVELFLEKGKLGAMRRGAPLSLRLAQNGHAKHNKLKTVAPMRRRDVQVKLREQDLEWEKYLISCYTQSNK